MSASKCFKLCEVKTWREAEECFLNIAATTREEIFFRGQADAKWPLQSKFDRAIEQLAKDSKWDDGEKRKNAQSIEEELLNEFRNACHRVSGGPELPKEENEGRDEFIAFAQHFGVPTKLLDWTRSPYVAAFFAFDGHNTVSVFPSGHDVAIWAFNWTKYRICLYAKRYRKKPDYVANMSPDEFEKEIRSVLTTPGPRIEKVQITGNPNRRMVYQEGLFTRAVQTEDDLQSYFDKYNDCNDCTLGTVLTKIKIPGSEQRQALQELSLMAITPVSLMNDPDGAAATAVNAVIRLRYR